MTENKWFKFDVIYYDFGAAVLLYSSAQPARNALAIFSKTRFDDKQLYSLILPYLEVSGVHPSPNPR